MKVSVWVGTTPSWEVLDRHLTFTFTEDGDAVPCRFGEAFGIDWFDDDYREASHAENRTLRTEELLQRHSHGAAIASALGECSLEEPCNAIVLLYEFEYSGDVKSAHLDGDTALIFLDCVDIPEAS